MTLRLNITVPPALHDSTASQCTLSTGLSLIFRNDEHDSQVDPVKRRNSPSSSKGQRLRGADVYLPQEINNEQGGGVAVKMRSGVSLAAADAELQPLLQRLAEERPRSFPEKFKVDIRPLTFEVRQNMGGTLYFLFAAVAMLLAIGCSNVSILLLAQGTARQHEFAVRSAVGASGLRIIRQLLAESLLLALTGTGLGILLAYRLLDLIVAWMPRSVYPPDVAIGINLAVLLFSAGVALLAAVLFGLFPALQMAKPEINQLMQSGSKRAAGSVRGRPTPARHAHRRTDCADSSYVNGRRDRF